ARKLPRSDDLDMDVEQVRHPQVFWPGSALLRRDDSRLLGASQDVPQRKTAGHRVRIRIVVEQDQHVSSVAEEPLILLHSQTRQGPAEFGQERRAEEIGDRKVVDLRKEGADLVFALARLIGAHAEHVHQAGTGVPYGFKGFAEAAFAAILDDDA